MLRTQQHLNVLRGFGVLWEGGAVEVGPVDFGLQKFSWQNSSSLWTSEEDLPALDLWIT